MHLDYGILQKVLWKNVLHSPVRGQNHMTTWDTILSENGALLLDEGDGIFCTSNQRDNYNKHRRKQHQNVDLYKKCFVLPSSLMWRPVFFFFENCRLCAYEHIIQPPNHNSFIFQPFFCTTGNQIWLVEGDWVSERMLVLFGCGFIPLLRTIPIEYFRDGLVI